MKLTKASIASAVLPSGKSEVIIFDDEMKGFGLRIRAGGKRTFIAQFRVGRKQSRFTIGDVAKIGIDAARAKAKTTLAKAQLGDDPQAEKAEERDQASKTFKSQIEIYIKVKEKRVEAGKLKQKSFNDLCRHLRVLCAPLAEKPLKKIKQSEVAELWPTIAEANGPFASNRCRASLSGFFTWAMKAGLVEANLVIKTQAATDEVKRQHKMTIEELFAAWHCAGEGDWGDIVRLLILTAQRRTEVGSMSWPEINAFVDAWTIPEDRAKNRSEHKIYLSCPASEILLRRARRNDSNFVFGRGKGGFSGYSKAKKALDKRMVEYLRTIHGKHYKLRPWRLHDIRRAISTELGHFQYAPHVVDALLNHVSKRDKTSRTYNMSIYFEDTKAALIQWAEFVTKMVETKGGVPAHA
jgi:integrase